MGIVVVYCANAVHAHGVEACSLQRLLLRALKRYIAHQAFAWMFGKWLEGFMGGYYVGMHGQVYPRLRRCPDRIEAECTNELWRRELSVSVLAKRHTKLM